MSSNEFIFHIQPHTKPRMTIRDKWKQRPVVVKYRAYKDQLNLMAKLKGFELPENGMGFVFIFEMPKSWSKKKREEMNGKPHKQTPDLDNIIKGFWDALAEEDKHLWKVSAIKRWGKESAIIVFNI